MNYLGLLKKKIRKEYKREFSFWLIAILGFLLTFFLFVRELKVYIVLSENKIRIEESYYKIQPEIIKFKEKLSYIDLNKDFSKKKSDINLTLDPRDIERAVNSISVFTDKDSFFILKEMIYKAEGPGEVSKLSPITITGELITFK